jgi:hypothetical protein
MSSLTVLTLLGLILSADPQETPQAGCPAGNGQDNPALVSDARVPVPYQRHVWYPTWDDPVHVWMARTELGIPAWEVPQRVAAPAFWKPLDR